MSRGIVFTFTLGFLMLAALGIAVYEIDRRDKSSSESTSAFLVRLNTKADQLAQQVSQLSTRVTNFSTMLAVTRPDIDNLRNQRSYFYGFYDTHMKTPTPCMSDKPRHRVAIVVTAGQSNASNTGNGPHYRAKHDVVNYNVNDLQCYKAEDPLLGATNLGANFATRLGDRLIESGAYDRVIIAPIAVGGTQIEDWIEGGPHHSRMIQTLDRLRTSRLIPDYILWAQGEANSGANSVPAQYRDNLRSLVRSIRAKGVTAPFIAALSTICGNRPPHKGVRSAIRSAAADGDLNIRVGPDTDKIGIDMRHDTCHFDIKGLEAAASMWTDSILRQKVEAIAN